MPFANVSSGFLRFVPAAREILVSGNWQVNRVSLKRFSLDGKAGDEVTAVIEAIEVLVSKG